ncbi:MAG TPA: PEP-CTERM/exosortase system-associated acyltransferase [Thermodesulfobacteriota bacterium]|nr:PEP-CTERM/exosortase system-associated acyltransferase [Thermodesulfobacteriota bacterium]HNU71722.1 PEP-CTERM/exosortase system-associated acyltransferase [Thermodesulfobacteriota bacterium]HOC38408.1 PEP-CTERM/exosortase system-associated acyltransferase [Thermodesulfobacteriota bacterium]
MIDFNFQKVSHGDTWLMEEIYRIRYQVYCLETGFLNSLNYPRQLEHDEFDSGSIHFVALNSHDAVGTVRLVPGSSSDLPIERHCGISIAHAGAARNEIAEVSRLAISKKYRRREGDGLLGISSYIARKGEPAVHGRRRRPEIILGLLREAYQESKRLGIRYWYAAMEMALWRLLKKYDFEFIQIGEEVDYYGPVAPYLGDLSQIEIKVSTCNPEMYAFFTHGLEEKLPDPRRLRSR